MGKGPHLSQYDVLVVGSGAAALTAAVTAASAGLSVLVLEKASAVGGTSALSGGVAWIPCNPRLDTISRETGENDSPERAMTYLRSLVGAGDVRTEILDAFVGHGRAMVEFLERNTEVRFEAATYPDYKAHLPGGMPVGRSIAAAPFDGARLGQWFGRLKRPMPELCLLGSMMVDGMDLHHLTNMGRSPRSLLHVGRRLGAFLADLPRFGRGRRLVMGNALVARLLKSALDQGVEIRTETPAIALLRENGRVVGATVRHEGRETAVRARLGVVLATGGFAHDEALKAEFIPHAAQHETICPETNTGDGLRMGLGAGGHFGGPTWHDFLGTQITLMRGAKGEVISKIPFLRRDRNKPGYVLVDRAGRRFVNEAWPYNDVAHAMNETAGAIPAFLICDHLRLRRYGLGLVRPGPAWARPLRRYLASGHLVRGRTLAELAAKLEIDPAGLMHTVERMNGYARSGRDEEFHKGETPYDRWQGDPEVGPNPCLGPIERGPFYAVAVWPGNLGTFRGLETDGEARVLDGEGKPIPGLFAAGCDMHAAFSGHYPGGGSAIGPGMTFGFIAARALAAEADLSAPKVSGARMGDKPVDLESAT